MEPMEKISQALERAKGSRSAAAHPQRHVDSRGLQPSFHADGFSADASQMWSKQVTLSGAYLESNRIVAHDIANPQSKSFDMLRTQVLQAMELKSWQTWASLLQQQTAGKRLSRSIWRSALLASKDDRFC